MAYDWANEGYGGGDLKRLQQEYEIAIKVK